MESVNSLIKRLDATLQKYNLPNYKKLEPPLSDNERMILYNKMNIDNNDLKEIYAWKNGYNINNNSNNLCQIIDYGTFFSLIEVLNSINANNKNNRWDNKNFVPIITDSTGQYLLFNNEKGSDYGKLYLYSASITVAINTISCYDSISSLFQTIIEAYEQNVLSYNEIDDWLDIDTKKYHALAAKFNINSSYWHLG